MTRETSVTEATAASAPASTTQAEGAGTAGHGLASAATVSLGLAAELQALASSGTADIDQGAVNAVREALASGRLQIDSPRTADGLLTATRELVSLSAANRRSN